MQYFFRIVCVFLCLQLSTGACLFAQDSTAHPLPIFVDKPPTDTSSTLVIIEDIVISGYKKTKPYIIEREFAFKKGEYILKDQLQEKIALTRQQLMNTSLFVEVEVTSKQEGDKVFVNVYVKERWYLFPLPYFRIVSRNFNQWWFEENRSLQRIEYGVKFMQYNVSGRNDNLNISLVSGYTQQIAFKYQNPFVDKSLKHGISVAFGYSRNREVVYATDVDSNKQNFLKDPNNFLRQQLSIELGYSYRPAIKTRHNFRFGYNDVSVDDSVIKANPNFFPNGKTRVKFPQFTYQIQYFDVDYIPYPTKGFWGDAYVHTRFGSDFMWQLGGKGTYTFQIFPKAYLQFQASGLIRFPLRQSFYSEGLFGGSDLYMRGLEYYVIDGGAGGMVRATAIKQALAFKVKNPIRIFKAPAIIPFRVMLKAYTDMGYAYSEGPATSVLNNKLLRTWGAGIDIITIYDLVLKIEFSFNPLSAPFKNHGVFFHTKSDF
jgi:outer membrane protein assembly factor BamA